MNSPYTLDERKRVMLIAIRRTRDKRSCAAQASENIGAKGGVIPDARERHWLQGLEQEGADAAGHHRREVGVDFPANGVGSEQSRVARRRRIIQRWSTAGSQARDAIGKSGAHSLDQLAGETG